MTARRTAADRTHCAIGVQGLAAVGTRIPGVPPGGASSVQSRATARRRAILDGRCVTERAVIYAQRSVLRSRAVARLLTCLVACICAHVFSAAIFAHPEISTTEDDSTVIVNDAPEQDVIAIGRSIIIKKQAKSALAIGGDVTVEGRVLGDVATIGGNIVQKENSYVGGDVFAIGGNYRSDSSEPLREAGKQTVTIGVFEEELRSFGQNPGQIFAPSFTLGFLVQRLLLALLWFVVSMVIVTLTPGAVSRAVSRIQLSTLKTAAIGSLAFVLLSAAIISGSLVLPEYLSVSVLLMGMLVLVLAYVFGRVTLQVTAGKLFFKYLFSEIPRSETIVTLTGVIIWTALLSLPYLWPLALFAIFALGTGLILTGRRLGT